MTAERSNTVPTRISRPSPLARLLDANKMALVGASPVPTRVGGIPVKTVEALATADRVLLVNGKYPEIAGQPCYPDLASLPWVPDIVVLAIGARDVMPTLRAAHRAGIGGAVIFAAGFAESGDEAGIALQAELVEFARDTGMLIAGPNCMGFANLHQRLFANFIGHSHQAGTPGPTAIISQSGNIIFALVRAAGAASTGFSYIVSTGNEACIDYTTYLEHFADDPNTGAVVGYVEQVRDGPRFVAAAARLRDLQKPLFLLKAGRSVKGAEATASHTAAMAGDADTYDTVFRQLNILTANEPQRVMDLVRMWQTGRRPAGDRIGVFSLSGAGCVLLADLFEAAGGTLPTFSDAVQSGLREVIPSYGMVSNPVDLTGYIANDPAFFPRVLDIMLESDEVDVAIIFVTGYLLEQFADVLVAKAATSSKLMVAIDTATSPVHETIERGGIPVFNDMNRAVAATTGYLRWARDIQLQGWQPYAGEAIDHALFEDAPAVLLTEVEAKAVLAKAGLPTVPEITASDVASASAAASSLGYPVVAKILSPDIAHKTEVGGVKLNLRSAADVRGAVEDIFASVARTAPAARIDGVVIQPQIEDGVPILLGITRDPIFGPMMTIGLGGVLTELYKDVSRRLLPVDRRLADEMLSDLRSRPLLEGFRGAPPCDIDALLDAMVRLSDFYLEAGGLFDEIELNPILARPSGAVAVDALITRRSNPRD